MYILYNHNFVKSLMSTILFNPHKNVYHWYLFRGDESLYSLWWFISLLVAVRLIPSRRSREDRISSEQSVR